MNFEEELKRDFIAEAVPQIQDAEQCFLLLEENPEDTATIDKIFRLAHNVKGGAKAVGFEDLGAFAHEFESLLLKVKKKEIVVNPSLINVLLRCIDELKSILDILSQNLEARTDSSAVVALINEALQGGSAPTATAAAPSPSAAPEVVDALDAPPVDGLPTIEELLAAEGLTSMFEMDEPATPTAPAAAAPVAVAAPVAAPAAVVAPAPAKPAAGNPTAEVKKTSAPIAIEESIRVSITRMEGLLNYIGEMVILQSVLNEQSQGENVSLLRKTTLDMGKITKEVQEIAMSLRMIPIKQTFQKLQRIARDTSNMMNKKIQLELLGEDTEVDKTVLENLSDPLVHIVRNAIDHGIETPEVRLANGKKEQGSIAFAAFHQAGKLVIEIRDDGAGIDPVRLTQKAKEKGVIPQNAELTREEAIHLVFHPGFSSKSEVTEISGRGVGMDVVKTNITRMNGEVHIETEVNKGSVFRITLPLTLAVVDGLIIRNDGNRFVVPLAHVLESVKINKEEVRYTTGLGELLLLRGENIPLFTLSTLLSQHKTKTHVRDAANAKIALLIQVGDEKIAVAVDDIVSQQQIVIKKLGNELQNLKGFSGSSVLGDGKPALILELQDLLYSEPKSKRQAQANAA